MCCVYPLNTDSFIRGISTSWRTDLRALPDAEGTAICYDEDLREGWYESHLTLLKLLYEQQISVDWKRVYVISIHSHVVDDRRRNDVGIALCR